MTNKSQFPHNANTRIARSFVRFVQLKSKHGSLASKTITPLSIGEVASVGSSGKGSIAGGAGGNDRTSIMFTLKNQVGGLARALQVFQELGINVLHLELQNTDSKVDKVNKCFCLCVIYLKNLFK